MASPAHAHRKYPLRSTLRLIACVLLGLFAPLVHAESEYEIKAAYLVNFAKLTDWPAASFPNGKGALIIGVISRGSLSDDIARTAAGASANGHPIEVRRIAVGDNNAIAGCHMIFVPETERAETIVTAAQGRPVLIVGESDNFARRGGAIGFVKDGGTIKFEVNPRAATRNGLTISAKLLRVARSIISP